MTELGPWRVLLIFNVSLLLWSEIVDGGLWEPIWAHLSNFAATGLVVLVLLKLHGFGYPLHRFGFFVGEAGVRNGGSETLCILRRFCASQGRMYQNRSAERL